MKPSICILAAAAVLTLSCSTGSCDLDTMLSGIFPDNEPGAAVLVLRGGETVFEKCYGLADLQTGEKITPETSFNIASVSKQFTAVAVLQLCSQGLLSLDDEVKMHFPEYTDPIWDGVCIRHLLSHSSGLPDARGGIPRELKLEGSDALALSYLDTLSFVNFPPGTQYEYINPTFVLLGKLVERVSGEPFEDYMREHIFTPAGMERTCYFAPDRDIPSMAHGYEYADVENMPEERTATADDGSPKDWYEYDYGEETFFATRPDGGIYTSVRDFAKWEDALMRAAVVDSALLAQAWGPHTKVSGSAFSDYQNRPGTWYGYGWFIEPQGFEGQPLIYHTGDNGGFKILAARIPSEQELILVFSNRADWDRYGLLQDIIKTIHK